MKPSVSKTVHVDKRPSFAGNLVTIFAGRAERTAETTAMRQTLPGKSRVGRILLNENSGQERLLDMKLSEIQNAQRKTAAFIYHQKKTFMARMEHRQNTWVREHSRRAGILNSMASRKRESNIAKTEGFYYLNADGGNTNQIAYNADNKWKAEPDSKEKIHNTRDSLPDINSARRKWSIPREKQTKSSKKNSVKSDGQTGSIYLPSVQNPRINKMPEDSQLPSVLITNQEHGNNEGALQCTHSSCDDIRNTKPQREVKTRVKAPYPTINGPSPTLISEILPKIQIQAPGVLQHLSRKTRRSRRRRTSIANDPLADERFLSLQHTLTPHRARPHESRDMAVIVSGVVNAKKLVSQKFRKVSKVEEDFEDL